MGLIVGVAIQKGGSGKTTTTYNLASILAEDYGCRVLAVDFDPQASLTHFCGVKRSTASYDMIARRHWEPVRPEGHAFDLVPSSIDLAAAELNLTRYPNWGDLLADALNKMRDQYDVILVDAPPSLGVLTSNVILAADALIIPVQTEEEAARGMGLLFESIKDMLPADRIPPVLAVLPTRYDARSNYHKEILAGLQEAYGELVMPPVKLSVSLPESTTMHQPISRYKRSLAGPYYDLAKRILEAANG